MRGGAVCRRGAHRRALSRRPRHDLVAIRRRGPEHAVVRVLLRARPRNLGREPLKERQRVKRHRRRSIAPVPSQAIDHAPIRHERKSLGRDGWPRDMATQMLEPIALACWHEDFCVQRKALVVAAQRTGYELRADVAAPTEARDGWRAFGGQRGAVLDGCSAD